MNTMKKDNNIPVRLRMTCLAALLETSGDTLDRIKEAAEAAAGNREAAKDAGNAKKESDSGLWQSVRALAENVDNVTAEHNNPKLSRLVLSDALEGLVEGEAAKTVAAYASTAGKLIEQVRAGRLNWATLPEAYNEVRAAMKSDAKKEIDAKAKELSKAIGRIKRHKLPAEAMKALNALHEAVERFAIEADASREDAKKVTQASKDIENMRQQHPSEPTTVETVATAA